MRKYLFSGLMVVTVLMAFCKEYLDTADQALWKKG